MFAVLEIQVSDKMAILTSTFDEMNDALSKYYQTMVSATQSAVPKHTVMIIDESGMTVKKETVFHEVEA